MKCPNCEHPVEPGATFCPECGASLGAPPAPAPSASPRSVPYPQPARSSAVSQLGATGQGASIWGPFAGYGTRREHVGWLLEGLGQQAEALRDMITERFKRRSIPNARVERLVLTGKGVGTERRPFYRIQRGLATVWLYVARFGQDLYVSQVSYVKGPISVMRLLAFGVLFLFIGAYMLNLLIATASAGAIQADLGGVQGVETFMTFVGFLACCTGPVGMLSLLAVAGVVVFSLYKFLTEKDILALFRAPPNEFQIDDIVSLEKAVNETVRQSADLIGIDRKLLAPDEARRWERRRLI